MNLAGQPDQPRARRSCECLRDQFQLKHLGFSDTHFARFIYSQWRLPSALVLVYRFILSAYTLSWQIYSIMELNGDIRVGFYSIPPWAFLTNWTYLVLTLYLFVHFSSCLWFTVKGGYATCNRPSRWYHRQLFDELHDRSHQMTADWYALVNESGSDVEDISIQVLKIPLIFKLVWVLFNIASSGCLLVTTTFWILIYPNLGELDGREMYINLQLHAITSVIVLIEHLVSAIPVRLLHFTHTFIYGLIYLVFSFVFYKVRPGNPVIYPGILDFDNPRTTAVIVMAILFVLVPLLQVFLFVIYMLKIYVYSKLFGQALQSYSTNDLV